MQSVGQDGYVETRRDLYEIQLFQTEEKTRKAGRDHGESANHKGSPKKYTLVLYISDFHENYDENLTSALRS